MSRAAKAHRVTIANAKRRIACPADQTILRAALAAGIDFPYVCATGNCGTCVCSLDAGRVSMLPRSDTALSREQAKAGQILACRARPRGDVTVTWLRGPFK